MESKGDTPRDTESEARWETLRQADKEVNLVRRGIQTGDASYDLLLHVIERRIKLI